MTPSVHDSGPKSSVRGPADTKPGHRNEIHVADMMPVYEFSLRAMEVRLEDFCEKSHRSQFFFYTMQIVHSSMSVGWADGKRDWLPVWSIPHVTLRSNVAAPTLVRS